MIKSRKSMKSVIKFNKYKGKLMKEREKTMTENIKYM